MNETTHFLEYLFKKYERLNQENKEIAKTTVPYFTVTNPMKVIEDFRNEKKNLEICNFFAVGFVFIY